MHCMYSVFRRGPEGVNDGPQLAGRGVPESLSGSGPGRNADDALFLLTIGLSHQKGRILFRKFEPDCLIRIYKNNED